MVSVEWLKKTELFESLNESQLNVLLSHSGIQSFSEKEMIFRQGEEATRLYILIQGAIDLTVKAQERIDFMTSKIEKEGAVFGTASLMEPFQYNVSALCLKPSEVLVLDANRIRDKLEEDPRMGMEVMRKLAAIYFNRLNELRSGVSNLLKIFKIKMP
ncbi:MAG: cyclic nucleotide-binding domain-containing protein [Thermodesulfobacteriota bacterium]|nr:cyclic nucleotide-binding domain-containing protein [Thermodesulfobacteriota bacterium]